MSSSLRIENKSSDSLLVKVTDNADWVVADLAGAYVKALLITAVTAGTGSGVAMAGVAGKLWASLKTLKDIYSVYSKAERLYRTADASLKKAMYGDIENLRKFMEAGCVEIKPNEIGTVATKHRFPWEGISQTIPQSFQDAMHDKPDDNSAEMIGKWLVRRVFDQVETVRFEVETVINLDRFLSPSVIASYFPGASDSTIYRFFGILRGRKNSSITIAWRGLRLR